MTDAVLFDMDGVFLVGAGTDPAVYRTAARDALAELGVEEPPADAAETLGAVRYDPAMDAACERLGVDRDEWWAAREHHASRRTNRRVETGDRSVYDDAQAVADLPADCTAALVTNNRQATADFVADHLFGDRLDAVVGREPTIAGYRRRKPDPNLIETALSEIGVSDGLYVGDRETDLVAAERAGLRGVFLEREHNDAAALAASPDHVVGSLSELPELVASLRANE
ncbi:HAD family hydrolase [Halorubrum gandharaense]